MILFLAQLMDAIVKSQSLLQLVTVAEKLMSVWKGMDKVLLQGQKITAKYR